jgi:hypothetical protein
MPLIEVGIDFLLKAKAVFADELSGSCDDAVDGES